MCNQLQNPQWRSTNSSMKMIWENIRNDKKKLNKILNFLYFKSSKLFPLIRFDFQFVWVRWRSPDFVSNVKAMLHLQVKCSSDSWRWNEIKLIRQPKLFQIRYLKWIPKNIRLNVKIVAVFGALFARQLISIGTHLFHTIAIVHRLFRKWVLWSYSYLETFFC